MPRRQIAVTNASATSCAVIDELMDQPTTRRDDFRKQLRQTTLRLLLFLRTGMTCLANERMLSAASS